LSNRTENIKVWQPLALSVMLAVGMVFGYKMNDKADGELIEYIDDDTTPAAIGQIEQLIRFIETRYVDSIDRDYLVDKAINSILDELDPHSVYISPEQIEAVNNEMEGKFKGIGVEIYYINDTVNIIDVVPEGPADVAGIESFDQLISINDSIVAGTGMQFEDIRKMLRGDIGNTLNITLLNKDREEKKLTLKIDDIPVSSVEGGVMIDQSTGYIKIDRFGAKTYKEFMDLLEPLTEDENLQNLIIDLRDNPGGYLPQATNILSQLFKNKGKLLVYTKGNNDRKFEYKSTGKVFFPIDKISVLINENSASGSEIMAGAIQDWDRGVIVGRRSFGKGLVQEQYDLSNGGALRLTVARYYTPSGRSIQRDYDDGEDYYADYENRYFEGEFFSRDSIEFDDERVFETKSLGRPVYGGGGITPDIFIPQDSVMFDAFHAEVTSELPRFVFTQIKDLDQNSDVDGLTNQLYEKYISIKENPENKAELKQFSSEIKRDIKASILNFLQNDDAVFKFVLPLDPFVKASLDYFYSENQLTDLLDTTYGEN